MHHTGSKCADAITASLQLLPVSPCNGLAVSYLRKTALEQQTSAPGLGVFLSLLLLLSLKKYFDLLVLHHLSRCTLVREGTAELETSLLAGFRCKVWWVQF